MRLSRACLAPVVLLAAASPAAAQLGEVQLGAVATWGTAGSYGPGGGLVFGVAAGRLTYVGLRWTYNAGATVRRTAGAASADVTSRVQVFAVDLGVLIPAGPVEIVPGLSIGALRFSQAALAAGGGAGPTSSHAVEFLASPGVAVQVPLGRVTLIPELQLSLSGQPDLPWPARHRGALLSLRLVLPIEVRRIRR